ncbi:MAG TPA: hypothetical protein VI454_07080 [Verrucomicrobiae bacterium]|jgi:hypothetical protein
MMKRPTIVYEGVVFKWIRTYGGRYPRQWHSVTKYLAPAAIRFNRNNGVLTISAAKGAGFMKIEEWSNHRKEVEKVILEEAWEIRNKAIPEAFFIGVDGDWKDVFFL